MNNPISNELQLFFENDDNIEKLNNCETPSEVVALFENNGITTSEEEIVALTKVIASAGEDGELTEADLDEVAGGIKVAISPWTIFSTAYDIVKTYGPKLYKLGYNGARKGWW